MRRKKYLQKERNKLVSISLGGAKLSRIMS